MPTARRSSTRDQFESISADIDREVQRQLNAHQQRIDKHRALRTKAEATVRVVAERRQTGDKVTLADLQTLGAEGLSADGVHVALLIDELTPSGCGLPPPVAGLATPVLPPVRPRRPYHPQASRAALVEWVRLAVEGAEGDALCIPLTPASVRDAAFSACKATGDGSLSEAAALDTVVRAAYFASLVTPSCRSCIVAHDGSKEMRAAVLATLRDLRTEVAAEGHDWFI
eukprot:TRINITY_DN6335_c0_g1_i1.p1 TRINITY_DN6335_c0_g1~~TRINITY_DN6335_c0_g1_i1.p1  ORF type:complete len:254 (+),score=97.25 TRINITY_DN6335_c0_g1_i1:79-762(+)